jgi:hypothetical protein
MQDQRSLGDLKSRRTIFCSIVLSSAKLFGAPIGEGTVSLIPDVFCRVKFGSIGRKIFHMNPGMFQEKLFDFFATVDRSPVPQQNHGASKMFEQRFKERRNIQSIEISCPKPEIEAQTFPFRGHRQCTDGGNPVCRGGKRQGFSLLEPRCDGYLE